MMATIAPVPSPVPSPQTQPEASPGPLSWLKSKATAVVHGLLTSVWVGGFAVGAIVVIVLAVLGGAWLLNHGVLQQFLPAPPPVVAPPEAIKISIHGPSPSVVISGVTSVFNADVIGPSGPVEWLVFPTAAANVTPSPDGKRIDLLAATDGKFSLVATIAGDGRQLAHARTEVEAMAQVIQQPMPPAPLDPVPPPAPVTPPAPVDPPKPVTPPSQTVADRMTIQLTSVNSENRVAEARRLANVLTSIIGRINAGAIGPHTDVANLVRNESLQALGPAAPDWDLFLSAIALVLDNFKNQGLISTAATTTPILSEIAGVLLKAQ